MGGGVRRRQIDDSVPSKMAWELHAYRRRAASNLSEQEASAVGVADGGRPRRQGQVGACYRRQGPRISTAVPAKGVAIPKILEDTLRSTHFLVSGQSVNMPPSAQLGLRRELPKTDMNFKLPRCYREVDYGRKGVSKELKQNSGPGENEFLASGFHQSALR